MPGRALSPRCLAYVTEDVWAPLPVTEAVVGGAQQIKFGKAPKLWVHVVGYPQASRTTARRRGTAPAPPDPCGRTTQGLVCNMTGGSSGGPWYSSFNPTHHRRRRGLLAEQLPLQQRVLQQPHVSVPASPPRFQCCSAPSRRPPSRRCWTRPTRVQPVVAGGTMSFRAGRRRGVWSTTRTMSGRTRCPVLGQLGQRPVRRQLPRPARSWRTRLAVRAGPSGATSAASSADHRLQASQGTVEPVEMRGDALGSSWSAGLSRTNQ